MDVEVARRLFTIQEYHQMSEVGILRPDTRTELIHGEIIKMSPIGNYHAAIIRRISTLFTPLLLPEYQEKTTLEEDREIAASCLSLKVKVSDLLV